MFAYQHTRGTVDVAFTDRHGGTSAGAYSSLNLGGHGDDPSAIAENTRRVVQAFAGGPPVPPSVSMKQVHGSAVAVVEQLSAETAAPVPEVDALVTAVPGVVLIVRVADCVPVLLADVDRGVVGAAHAGRAGMADGIIANTVAAMRALGAGELVAWVGPHVCGGCYEVPERMRAEVVATVPESFAQTAWGTPALDLGRGVAAQLAAEGVIVTETSGCTVEDDDLFSYRRQGTASGRLAGLVRIHP